MKKEVYHIYLFRHGQTVFNKKGIFTGWLDSKLTSRGKKDAMKVAKKLKSKKFQVAFHTKLSRSKDTLKYILKFHPECRKLIQDNRMIERRYGILEGVKHSTFIKDVGKKMYNLKVEGDAIENLSPSLRKRAEKFLGEKEYESIHRGYNVAVPRGESFANVEKRVGNFIQFLKRYVRKHKVNVAISGHGNSIRIFRKIWENTSKDEATKWFIPYDKVYEYDLYV
jgi:2,3-bisphosphoglycerate-dependent phosphoglycerate mutase